MQKSAAFVLSNAARAKRRQSNEIRLRPLGRCAQVAARARFLVGIDIERMASGKLVIRCSDLLDDRLHTIMAVKSAWSNHLGGAILENPSNDTLVVKTPRDLPKRSLTLIDKVNLKLTPKHHVVRNVDLLRTHKLLSNRYSLQLGFSSAEFSVTSALDSASRSRPAKPTHQHARRQEPMRYAKEAAHAP